MVRGKERRRQVIKNFINNIYPKILEKVLGIFDVSSDRIVGTWSIVLLVGCMYSIWTTKTVTTPVAMIFSTIVTGFAGHKIVKVWKGTDSNSQVKNLDVQGQGDNNGKDSAKPQS